MTNNKKIVMASITVILAAGLLALNPSIIGDAQAQGYNSEYGYDNSYYPEPKSAHTDIQKIDCRNSNVNVNGVDVTEIPQDGSGVGGPEAANTENGNALADRINFERNLVNICANVNDNEQVRVTPPDEEPQPTGTLTVTKNFGCLSSVSPFPEDQCQRMFDLTDPNQFNIRITGNDPNPSYFAGSGDGEPGTEVTIGVGDYVIDEQATPTFVNTLTQLENEFEDFDFQWIQATVEEGDCTLVSAVQAEGTIEEGESETCTLQNLVRVSNEEIG
jgi:hypothetical protein